MKNGVDKSAPPLIRQINNGNWLPQQEAEALRDGSEFVMTRERKTGLINVTMFGLRGALTRSRIVLLLAACGALAAGGGSHADDVFGDRPEESVSFRAGGDKTLIADDRAKYTIGFGADGRVRARIDCNGVMTTWKSPGPNQLHMGPPWLTRPLCTPGSVRDLVFLALMADAGADDFAAIGGAQATGAKSPVASKGPFKYECRQANGDKDTLIATFYETSPAMVLIERRGHARPAFRVPAASGSKTKAGLTSCSGTRVAKQW